MALGLEMGMVMVTCFPPFIACFGQVSALGLDPSGARLVTGGYDYDVKFWDFAGMDASFKAFRSLQPCEWYVFTYSLHIWLLYLYTWRQCCCHLTSVYNE